MQKYCQKMSDGYVYPFSQALSERPDMRVIRADPKNVVNGYLKEEETAEVEKEGEGPANHKSPGLADMTKDMLEAHARKEYGAELDKRFRKDVLVRQVEAMQQGMTPQEALQITE